MGRGGLRWGCGKGVGVRCGGVDWGAVSRGVVGCSKWVWVCGGDGLGCGKWGCGGGGKWGGVQ